MEERGLPGHVSSMEGGGHTSTPTPVPQQAGDVTHESSVATCVCRQSVLKIWFEEQI